MAPKGPNTKSGDSLLQLALSITPTTEDPFDTQQEDNVLDGLILHAEPTDRNPNLFAKKVPPIVSDPQSVDDMIASQMAKLSVDDREKVYMDVHGIPDEVTETPELIHLSLLDLQNEIELLPDKEAYIIAERLDSEYVHDRDFRLAFLRCDSFDFQKAALRIVRHFQMKLDLFGLEKLVLHITQDDLDVEAMDVLQSCVGRLLNKFDRAGRVMSFCVSIAREWKTDPFLRKSFYHLNMTAFRSEQIQRRGATAVIRINDGKMGLSGRNAELNWKLCHVNQASPLRVSAFHYCCSSEAWRVQEALSKAALSQPQQVRVRVYQGTVKECLEELRGFGIDPASIPLDDKGEITDVEECRRWYEEHRRYERLNFPLRSTFYVPFCEDVLLGKGTPIQNHAGNKRLRQLISEHIKQYDKSQRGEKKAIALGIVDAIRQRGGLFLKQDGSKWTMVNDDVARLKVTAAFRTYRQSLKLQDD